jgi:hypothetical protein
VFSVELVVIVVEYRNELHHFRRGGIHNPERPSGLLLGLALLGAGLVAVGVAGEFFIHIKAGRVETDMRNATASLVASVNGKASDANKVAGEAKEREGQLEKEAAELRKQNIENERALEQEKKARLELEAKVGWRTVTPAQIRTLRKFLLGTRRRIVVVTWSSLDPEQDSFGPQLASALGSGGAGLSVVAMSSSGPIARPGEKLPPISLGDTSDDPALAMDLEAALVFASLAKYPIPKRAPIGITVGGHGVKIFIGPRNAN